MMQGYHLARPMPLVEFDRRFAGPASRAVALVG